MAEIGLNYFPLACDFEDKIELIEAEFGLRGFAIIVKLYQKIYGGFGYYCEWNSEVALLFSRKACGLQEGDNVVSEVVNTAIKRDIFNSDMFSKYGILTSTGIQKRFFEAVKRRNKVEIEKHYLLLSEPQIPSNVYIISKNVYTIQENVCRNQQSKVKESKVKESKESIPAGSVASSSARNQKHKHGEYKNVLLTDKEFIDLSKRYGDDTRDKAVKYLDEYIEDKGYRSKSHNMAIHRWVIDAVKEHEAKRVSKPGFNEFAQAKDDSMLDEMEALFLKEVNGGVDSG